MITPGRRLALAIGAKDRTAIAGLLAADVDFKGLTPRRFWEADSADGVLEILFGSWFEDQDRITEVVTTEDGEAVADTAQVSYRFAVDTPDGPHTVEQTAYYRTAGERIGYLRVLCSGFRPTDGPGDPPEG